MNHTEPRQQGRHATHAHIRHAPTPACTATACSGQRGQARLHTPHMWRDAPALDAARGQPFAGLLPAEVSAPGAPVTTITPAAAAATGLPEACLVCAGTTGAPQGRLPSLSCASGCAGRQPADTLETASQGRTTCASRLRAVLGPCTSAWTHGGVSGAQGGGTRCEQRRGRGRQRGGVCGGGRGAAGRGGDVAGLHAGGQAAERRARGRCGDRRVQPPPGRCLARGCGLGLGLPYPSTRRFKSKGNPARDLSLTL